MNCSTDNSTDLFTKTHEHHSIVRHTEAMRQSQSTRGGIPVQDKWKNGRADANGLAQQYLRDHIQGRTERR